MPQNSILPISNPPAKINNQKSFATNSFVAKKQEGQADKNKPDKATYAAIAAGIAAVAIGGLLYLKGKGKANPPQEVTGVIDNNIPNSSKIDDIKKSFSEKLKFIFRDDIDCGNFDKVADAETLNNGSKRIVHNFTDKNGVEHTVKLVVDKDGNFVNLFDKSVDNTIDAFYKKPNNIKTLSKYNEDNILIGQVRNDSGLESCQFKSYLINNEWYNKKTYYEDGKKISQKVTKGIINETDIRDWQLISDMNGKSVKLSTDYTGEKPVKKIEFLTPEKTDEVIVFKNKKPDEKLPTTPVTVYKVDDKGNVVEEIEKEISSIWQQEASFVDINKAYDVKPWKNIYACKEEAIRKCHNKMEEPDFYNFLKKNENMTIDSDFNTLFDGIQSRQVDIPERFAIMVQNTNAKKGNAYICDEIPKLFEGIEENKIEKAIDSLMNEYNVSDDNFVKEFIIDGKKFRCKPIGGGVVGSVFKIEDINGNSVVVKRYGNPTLVDVHGVHSEIPMLRQLSLDKVDDVPKFYMANPLAKYSTVNGVEGVPTGGWMMSEYIGKDTPVRQNGTKLATWLKEHNLIHGDLNSGAFIGDYVVDVGGIYRPKNTFNQQFGQLTSQTVTSCNQHGYKISDIIRFMENA